jgi:hypothetical protein
VTESSCWGPKEQIENVVNDHWGVLSAMSHRGLATLKCYVNWDDLGSPEPEPGSHAFFLNSVALGHIAVALAISLATNVTGGKVQIALGKWKNEPEQFFGKWKVVERED